MMKSNVEMILNSISFENVKDTRGNDELKVNSSKSIDLASMWNVLSKEYIEIQLEGVEKEHNIRNDKNVETIENEVNIEEPESEYNDEVVVVDPIVIAAATKVRKAKEANVSDDKVKAKKETKSTVVEDPVKRRGRPRKEPEKEVEYKDISVIDPAAATAMLDKMRATQSTEIDDDEDLR